MKAIYLTRALVLIAVIAPFATLDTAAAGAGTDNRAPAPKTASTSSGGSSHGTIVNDTRASPTVKTDQLCKGHHCNWTHTH